MISSSGAGGVLRRSSSSTISVDAIPDTDIDTDPRQTSSRSDTELVTEEVFTGTSEPKISSDHMPSSTEFYSSSPVPLLDLANPDSDTAPDVYQLQDAVAPSSSSATQPVPLRAPTSSVSSTRSSAKESDGDM